MTCAYPSCNISRNQGIRFHRFPVNKERAMQWAIICQSPELIELVSEGNKFYNKRLCSLHFERPAFNNDLKISLTKLAVPTIFADRPKHTESSSPRPSLSSTNAITNVESTCENTLTTEKVQQLNEDTSNLHYTLAEIIADTVGLDNNQSSPDFFYDDEDLPQLLSETNPVEESEELNADDIDLPQISSDIDINKDSTQEFSTDGKSMFPTVASRTSKPRSPTQTVVPTKERTALFSIDENNSKELLCRLCAKLVSISQMVNIFGTSSSSKEYLRQMNQLLPYSEQPAKEDRLPKWICKVCCERLDYCDQVIHDFTSASVKLNHLVSTPLSKKHKALMTVNLTSTCSNSKSATRQDNNESLRDDTMIIKEEYLGNEQFEEGSFNYSIHHSAKQQHTNIQQIRDNQRIHHASQKRTNYFPDSHTPQCPCSQCVDVFSDKCSRLLITAHMSEAKYKKDVLSKPQTIHTSVPLIPDCSSTKSVPLKDIKSPVKRKECEVDDELQPISVPLCPMSIKMESVDHVPTDLLTNKQFTSSSQPSKIKLTRRRYGEFLGNMIESSQTMIPTSSDNKTFICDKCNISFGSIESALTHRFKEHREEEIRRTRPT